MDDIDLENINDETEEVQLEAIKQDDDIIELIENQSLKVQLLHTLLYPNCFDLIDDPYEEVIEYANTLNL
jgi:hypothetical protein